MTNKLITSPEATILFSALRKPQTNQDGKAHYNVRLEVVAGTKGADEFRNTLKGINKSLVVTESKGMELAPGNFIFNARSEIMPAVYDKGMNRIPADLIPMIESGTARAILTSFESKNSTKGGGITLVGVQLLDIVEYVGSGTTSVSDDDLEAALRANS